MDLLLKLIKGENPTEKDIEDELYEICDREHSVCSSECPVFFLNNNSTVNGHKPFDVNRGCDCFKNGKAMRTFIANHI